MALWRLRATVDDRPGFLAVLTASLALSKVNIVSVQVHGTEVGAVDDFLVDAPDTLSETELLAAVAKGHGRDAWVRRTEVNHLVDAPTEMAVAAARIVRDPDTLAGGARECAARGARTPCRRERGSAARLHGRPDADRRSARRRVAHRAGGATVYPG